MTSTAARRANSPMRAGLFGLAGLALALLSACGPAVWDLEAGEKARVVRVIDGDTVELDSGLRVHLVSLEAPRDKAWGPKARQALERLTLQRAVWLRYGGLKRAPKTKRHPTEAALAHLYAKTEGGRWVWVQEAMLRTGLARVHTHKDNLARVPQLLRLEAQARKRKEGIWRDPAFAVRAAESAPDGRGFVLVEGVVHSVARSDERVYLNFGEQPGGGFSVVVEPEDVAAFSAPTPEQLQDRRVRVRGYLKGRGGALMRADHPAQLEVLSGA